jgi:predicted amidohydrolase
MARYARIATVTCGGGQRQQTVEQTVAANREAQLRLLERAAHDRPDAICFTEVITSLGLDSPSKRDVVPEPLDGPTVGAFAAAARRHRRYVVLPILTREGGRVYNSAILLDRRGQIASVYHKIHPTIGEIERGVTPGTETVVTETDFGRVGFAICYDLNFRDVGEGNAAGGAELVFFPSMYCGGLQASIWAFDFGFYLASANPAQGSRIVDPLGRVLVTSDETYEPVISRRINLDYAVIHLDYNGKALPRLKEKYGPGAQIDVARPEAVACLYSEAEGVSVNDMIAEFGLERRRDYFERANRVRRDALAGYVDGAPPVPSGSPGSARPAGAASR